MKTIKLTYVLELELPLDALLADGDTFVRSVRQMLRLNEALGWKARLRRLAGVDQGDPV